MGKRNRERVERISAGLEKPIATPTDMTDVYKEEARRVVQLMLKYNPDGHRRSGAARHGGAWRGKARPGTAWRVKARIIPRKVIGM